MPQLQNNAYTIYEQIDLFIFLSKHLNLLDRKKADY